MMPLSDSPYQKRLLQTFWDMADIFFFKRKDGSEVEKIFVDYWFGINFECNECDASGMVDYEVDVLDSFGKATGDKINQPGKCDLCGGEKRYGGEVANTEEELINNLKFYTIPVEGRTATAYDAFAKSNMEKTRNRWAMFKKYGVFKDGYRGKGETQGNIIVDVPLLDGGISQTLFSCHTDSVHRTDGFQAVTYTQDPSTGYIIQSSNNECLGGDDGTGVWLMTKLIEAGVPGRYIFHRAEEVGGRGSGWIIDEAPYLLNGYKRAIAFDRKSKHSIITYQSCSRGCSDEFADDLGGHLMYATKKYYLERFQAGDPTVMYDVQAPIPQERTRFVKVKGARSQKVTSTNAMGYTTTTWKVPEEEQKYIYTPKNEFWSALSERFQPMAPTDVEGEEYMFSSEELQALVQNYAIEYPEEMMTLLEEYLKFKEEIWKTDTGGSFTDTANYTDFIPECTNLSSGYYNAHTQSEYQDYAFLEVFLEGLIATPWEELHTADPPKRDTQSYGYYSYGNTYVPPSKTILSTASESDVTSVRQRQADQKERRKKEREEKRAIMDMFGMTKEEAEEWIDENSEDDLGDWEEVPALISSFWDDVGSARPSEFNDFYMAE